MEGQSDKNYRNKKISISGWNICSYACNGNQGDKQWNR